MGCGSSKAVPTATRTVQQQPTRKTASTVTATKKTTNSTNKKTKQPPKRTSTPSTPKSDLELKLDKINSSDPSLIHFKACWGDDLTEEQAILLVQALSDNKTIQSIEFCANPNLGLHFCKAMARLLDSNPTLVVVSLRSNTNFGDEGIRLICHAMTRNTHLLELKIDNCNVEDAGAAVIGKMLSFNRKLFRLDISDNPFTSCGADLVADGIIRNSERGGGLLEVRICPFPNYDYNAAQGLEAAMLQNPQCMIIVPNLMEDQFDFTGKNKRRRHHFESRMNGLRTKYDRLF